MNRRADRESSLPSAEIQHGVPRQVEPRSVGFVARLHGADRDETCRRRQGVVTLAGGERGSLRTIRLLDGNQHSRQQPRAETGGCRLVHVATDYR